MNARRDRGSGTVNARRDRGSGTVLVVGGMAVLLTFVVGALMIASAVLASHRAHSAADLAALAAAGDLVRTQDEGAACSAGRSLALRNGATMTDCQAGPDLSVEVSVQVASSMPGVGTASAKSRAGPR